MSETTQLPRPLLDLEPTHQVNISALTSCTTDSLKNRALRDTIALRTEKRLPLSSLWGYWGFIHSLSSIRWQPPDQDYKPGSLYLHHVSES